MLSFVVTLLCSNPVKKLFHNRVSSSKISIHKKKLLVVIEYELNLSLLSFFLSFSLDLQWLFKANLLLVENKMNK